MVAVVDAARALPFLIPALGDRLDSDAVLDAVDGIMLTGGVSNIEPHHYGQEPAPGEDVRDPGRDVLCFALVRGAVRRGIPLLGVCRGIQEMNVAFGGTLHQRLHEVPGRRDHRRNREIEFEESIAPRDSPASRSGRAARDLARRGGGGRQLPPRAGHRPARARARRRGAGGRRDHRGGLGPGCSRVRGRRAVARRDQGARASAQPGDTEGVRRCGAPARAAPPRRRPRRGGGLTGAVPVAAGQRRARNRNRNEPHRTNPYPNRSAPRMAEAVAPG